jgi:cellulose synthase/poly-beta-1,6-N-acetylglucosamine synthase-like glycosyltransferase
MISIIITAYKEERTIGQSIESLVSNDIREPYEILVVCPDEDTKKEVYRYAKKYKEVQHVQDEGKGKPSALNKAFKIARGQEIILTDGDVFVSKNAIKPLLIALRKKRVGAVSGRPVSISPKDTMLGFWSHLLTDAGAHLTRLDRIRVGDFIVVSGYLFAMKRLIDEIPEYVLAEDGVISYMIWKKGYKIDYAEEAVVYVKYPSTFKDWILQKRRSTGGYKQIKEIFGNNVPRMRTFKREIIDGTRKALAYPSSIKELLYTGMLFLARLYLWFRIYTDLYLKKSEFKDIWKRVESTK